MSIEETNSLIASDKLLILAGNETALKKLIKGSWIGGTIPYFIDENGGCFNKDKIFVTDLSEVMINYKIREYSCANLSNFTSDRYKNGFTWLLVPAFSEIHKQFSIEVYNSTDIYDIPVMGWITGVDLSELGKISPKVINGETGNFLEDKAISLHVQLPESKYASLEIINLFEQGNGDSLYFNNVGFSCTTCSVNGKTTNLAEYIIKNNIDTRLPLVADYSGAMINISIQNLDKDKKTVTFYAPVRENVEYKFAHPINDYIKEFNALIPSNTNNIIGSCNCILNYLYSELEGKKTGKLTGPITFGEIAYVLVNQTMVYLSIENK